MKKDLTYPACLAINKHMRFSLPAAGQFEQLAGLDDAAIGWWLAQVCRQRPVCYIARNDIHMQQIAAELAYFAPQARVIQVPAWDVQPYDRLAPDVSLQAQRLAAVGALAHADAAHIVVLSTVNAVTLRLPPAEQGALHLQVDAAYPRADLLHKLNHFGFKRVHTVTEPGEFAVRGALIDIFPPLVAQPLRLDFFDDTLESIKPFDVFHQRTADENWSTLDCAPFGEVPHNPHALELFRKHYRGLFANVSDDPLYQGISAGQMPDMAIHYLPLFYEKPLPTLFDLLPAQTVCVAPDTINDAITERQAAIQEAYALRQNLQDQEAAPYRPLPPAMLYVDDAQWHAATQQLGWVLHSPFVAEHVTESNTPAATGHMLAGVLQQRLPAAAALVTKSLQQGQNVILTAATKGALSQLQKTLAQVTDVTLNHVQLEVSPLQHGFTTADTMYLTHGDVFGQQQQGATASRKRHKQSGEAILHFSELSVDDAVVHADHGVARFAGLETMEMPQPDGAPIKRDFLKLLYADNDRVYVPVESLHLVTRYKASETSDGVVLDKLGGAAWQARKARVKKNLMAMAGELIDIASQRELCTRPPLEIDETLYNEFGVTFPHNLTEEQQNAIEAVVEDMTSPRPMDRLVIGDVGFGKTEVALRAAFLAAAAGRQVAVVCPTTLLARQHTDVFTNRLTAFGLKVGHISRLVSAKDQADTKAQLKAGTMDIVIGTHALLAESVRFKSLGLVIVDEEQRFGVKHKERLKALKAEVDVMTLTATPIPRTLHMALGGLRQMSVISTPPVDRLAVRSYVLKFDPKVMREAIMREIHRGGQVYAVCPRVQDIPEFVESLEKLVPEADIRVGHGQMGEAELERVMHAFYNGAFNVLVATTIIESGLDVPRANTLIVHRADRFGLAQLHQLRGRVGRSSQRAYAYFLLPAGQMTDLAARRLQVLQKLDYLGAGFQLASFDMDFRGAGNLVGQEQSGHINEVGFELYTHMLKEAISARKAEMSGEMQPTGFTPQLNVGFAYRLPEDYIDDIATRMQIYRRLAHLEHQADIDDLAAELQDRFGPLPQEAQNLLYVMQLRQRCVQLNIEKLDVGPAGIVVGLHQNTFAAPAALLGLVQENPGLISLQPDQSLLFHCVPGCDTTGQFAAIHRVLARLEELKDVS